MWTVRSVTYIAIRVPTWAFGWVFPCGRRSTGGRQPWATADTSHGRTPATGNGLASALADPAETRLGRRLRRRLVLAVAPVAAGALVVVTLPARHADHALYCAALAIVLLWRGRNASAASARACLRNDDVTPMRLLSHRCHTVWGSRNSVAERPESQLQRGSTQPDVRRRWRGAYGDGVRPNARPRSAHPTCRTSPVARPRSSSIQAVPGKRRRPLWPCAP